MSLLGLEFCESWQGFKSSPTGVDTADASNKVLLPARWTDLINTGAVWFTDAYGKYIEIGSNGYLFKTMTHQAGWTVGFRFRVPNSCILWTGYNNDTALCNISVNVDNTLTLRAGGSGSGALIGTTDFAVHSAKWYYGEVTCALTNSGGFVHVASKLKINGQLLLDGEATSNSSIVNLTSGTATINRHSLTGICDYRDIVFRNLANAFGGDVKIIAVRPNGDVVSQFTPTGGGAHYSQVNDEYSDFDATYAEDATVGQQDIWDWEDIPSFSGTIQAIQISMHARKTDEGLRTFKIVTGDTGTEAASPEIFLADDYICYHTPQDLDPATSLPYTRANFNAKRFGVKVIA